MATKIDTKTSVKKCVRVGSNFIAFIPTRSIRQMLANLSSHFHVEVVKRRQGNVQKKRDARAKMLFCLLNLSFSKTFSLPSRRWILGPVYIEVGDLR